MNKKEFDELQKKVRWIGDNTHKYHEAVFETVGYEQVRSLDCTLGFVIGTIKQYEAELQNQLNIYLDHQPSLHEVIDELLYTIKLREYYEDLRHSTHTEVQLRDVMDWR